MPQLTQETAYQAAIGSLYERINYEKTGHPPYSDANYRLDRMRRLLAALGDPQLAAPVVHIAGTKGKGSTATLVAHMLSATGLRTGLYTSPHLIHLEERFQIDGRPCPCQQLVELVELLLRASQVIEHEGLGRPTFFELTTALAFLHFARNQVDVAVLEVGLGGRLDSTNVCQPAVTVITTIGLDHQAQLGHTITAIAGEKAGIIKPRIPIICTAKHPEAREVISRRAAQLEAPLRIIDRDFSCVWQPIVYPPGLNSAHESLNNLSCALATYYPNYRSTLIDQSPWSLAMLGSHHADNLAAALCAVDTLAALVQSNPASSSLANKFFSDPAITLQQLQQAVSKTTVPARLQVIGTEPVRLIDTAHNPDSIAAMDQSLGIHFPGREKCYVLATSKDKDIQAILRLLTPGCRRIVLTQYRNNPRGLPLAELTSLCARVAPELEIHTSETPANAWQLALQLAGPRDLVCATGSFFLAAELLAALNLPGMTPCQSSVTP